MRVISEIEPKNNRQLKHSFVEGRDNKYYKILTYQLYDIPQDEFPSFEVNVQEVDANGQFSELIVPYFKRFYKKEDAISHHLHLLEHLDEVLNLEEAKQL